jgi:hypothetical protein
MSNAETRAFTVRVPVEQAEALELIAKTDGISVAEEVRGALLERIEAREDLLVIGEQVLGVPAKDLATVIDIALADSALASPAASFGGHEFCSWL